MTNSKEHVVNQMVKLLKSNPKDEALFFEQEKNYKWFEALIPYGFFKPETIKSKVIEGESYYYPAWSQGAFIETIAKQIQDNKITDENFIKLYLGVLRSLFITKDNLWAIRILFKSVFLIPAKYLNFDDVEKVFNMIEDVSQGNRFVELDVHESYFSLLKSVGDNNHDRSIFKEYIKFLLSSKPEKIYEVQEWKLTFFRDHRFSQFSDKFMQNTKKNNKAVIEDVIFVVSSILSEHLKDGALDNATTRWRPAIEPHHQNQFKDSASSIFAAILYEASKILLSIGHIPNELQNWKTSDKNTFTRIYIALVIAQPEIFDLNECANRILTVGLRYQLRYEVYHFLEKNFDILNPPNQASILDAIKNIEENSTEENDPREPLYSAWEMMRWLPAIKNSKNEEAKKLYEEVYKITNGESEHPDFDSYLSSVKWGLDSPVSMEVFEQLKPSEIIQKINELKDKKNKFGEPFSEGLSRTFEDFVVKEPLKCSVLIKDVLTLPSSFISSLYNGYSKCWVEKKFVPVEDLLDLTKAAFQDDSFCKEVVDKDSRTRWSINAIFRFISTGVRDDENAFKPALNIKCYEVLKLAVDLVKPNEDYKGSSDALTRALNEPRGVIFESAILLALRQARLCYDNSTNSVTDDVGFQKAWTNLFEVIKGPLESQNEQEVSLHAHIGALYRQFLFLNKDWLCENLDLVCPSYAENPELWSAFMQGFCYVNVYIKEMYSYLNGKGYLLKFLRTDNESPTGTRINTLQEQIISFAMIAVLLKDESLEKGLLKEILNADDEQEWNRVIRKLSRIVGDKPESEILFQAKEIISYLLDKFDSVQDKAKALKYLEGVGWLLEIFDDPSDILVEKIIKIAAFYSKAYWDHYEIVEYLEPFKDSHTETVGKLFLELIKDDKGYPAYPEEKIIAICNSLKLNGKTTILANICRFYSDKMPTSKLTKEICALL